MKTLHLSIIVILFVAVFLSINVVFAQTNNNQNLMMVVKTGNVQGADYQNGTYSQTVEFGGNVGTVQTGQPVVIKIFKNNFLYKTDLITAGNITSDKLFWYQITVTGKSALDSYKIDFIYGNQTVEEGLPVIPPPPPMVSNDCNVKSKRMLMLPLQQLTICGSPSDGIICNTGFQLILKAEDGSPACVKPQTATKLIQSGWAKEAIQAPLVQTPSRLKTNQTASPTAQIIPSCVSQIPHQYAIAGPPGATLCPVINFEASGKILNATGFYGIYNYTAYPGTLNFVLEPGHNGTITYLISINAIHNFGGNSEYSNEINITNGVVFMHDAGMNNHPGVDVLVEPKSEMIGNNGSAFVTITFSASKAALHGTYWVTLPPGVCVGGEMLILTITDCTK